MSSQEINLSGREVSNDAAMQKVIEAQSRVAKMARELVTLRKDRNDLLKEFADMQSARKVEKCPPLAAPKADTVRVSVGDVHGMRQDKKAVAAFLRDIKELSPNHIILGGDIISCDGFLASKHALGFVANLDYTYQEDVQAASAFLDAIQKACPNAAIEYVEGNHEHRVERYVVDEVVSNKRDAEFLLSLISPKTLLRLDDRGIPYFKATEAHTENAPLGWIKRGEMYFVHSLAYSKNAARDALNKTAANVTYFCSHREDTATSVFPSVGLVKAFNPGCLCIMQPVYMNTNPTNWSQGYAIDFITKSGLFQRVHVPIWRGTSLAKSMVERFKS